MPTPPSPSDRRLLLSVVSPCFNEESVIELFHRELARVLDGLPELDAEIVLVDDGSRDRTLAVLDRLAAADPRVRPVALSRNFGHQIALSAGLDAARGDLVVLMDSDLQHPPDLLPAMLQAVRGGADIVSTIRRTTAAPWLQRLTSRAFYWLLNRLSEVPIEPAAADFCLLTARVRDQLVAMPERHRLLRGMIAWVGFARTFLPFDAPPRAAGRTKYSWRKRMALAVDGILGFSTAPMRLAIWVGLWVAGLGALYLLYVLGKALWTGDVVTGWPSLISVTLILGGLQIVFIGVIGAYLGRVFEQAKGRPLYVLRRDVPPPEGPVRNRTLPVAVVVAVAVVAVVWAAVAGLPLLSESYTQLALVQRFASPADAFDPQLVPFRPLQHLTFHWFERFADGAPAVGRAFTFGLHALAACLVFAIVRRLGAPARGAWVAMLLFLAFPTAKGLTWVAAVSGPGRTACLLWIVWATIAYTQRPTRGLGVALVIVFAVALGFHQSSIVAPAIFGLGVVCLTEGNLRERLRAVVALARRPALVVFALFAVGYFLYVGTLQNRSYHGIVQPGAIAANVARAALALAPEWVRLPALEGLRDAEAPLGFVLGAAAVAGMLGLWALGLWRGRAEGKWLLLAIPLDLALPILTTGFVGRYAYFAAALLAIVLGLRFAHAGPGRAGLVQRLLIGVLAVAWAVDHVVDVRELRQAGAIAEQLLADATAARAAAPAGVTIALVDAPDHVGREDDIPLFNWGLAEALARRSVPGPWLLLRVDACWTTSDHRALREEDLPAALAEPGLLVLRYDAGHRTFAAFRPR